MPKPAKSSARNAYVEFVCEQCAPLGAIRARSAFGGHILYCNDIPFAIIADSAVFLKADDQNRPAFEQRGLKPFKPFEDQPGVMQYYEIPAELFEDPDVLRAWGSAAVDAGRRAQAKKAPKKRVKK